MESGFLNIGALCLYCIFFWCLEGVFFVHLPCDICTDYLMHWMTCLVQKLARMVSFNVMSLWLKLSEFPCMHIVTLQ